MLNRKISVMSRGTPVYCGLCQPHLSVWKSEWP